MNSQIKQPNVPSRAISSRSSSNFLDKSLSGSFSGSFEDPLNSFLNRKASFTSKGVSQLPFQQAQKSNYMLYKTDPNLMPQLLERYSQANLYYRDEEFSQQADLFLTKLAMDRKIPDEFRSSFPLYQILVSISKISMFNEFEILVFACMLDHCTWNIDDVLSVEEGSCLIEFPANFGLEVGLECKRFIIYLLIIAFSVKQFLGEKNEVDQIQAYCEHICGNFQQFFNRWTKVGSFRFNYSLPELNRKFRYLAKRDITGYQSNVKDYNMMVDEILGLTGSYTARTKEPRMHVQDQYKLSTQKEQVFHEAPYQTFNEIKPVTPIQTNPIVQYGGGGGGNIGGTSGIGGFGTENKGFNRLASIDFNTDPGFFKVPSFFENMKRDPSMTQLMANLPLTTKQPSYSNFDDMIKKKLKEETNPPHLQTQPSLFRDPSSLRYPELQPSFSNVFRQEDFSNLNLPTLPLLSKKSSVLSQGPPDDLPALSRFQSNLSFLYDNK